MLVRLRFPLVVVLMGAMALVAPRLQAQRAASATTPARSTATAPAGPTVAARSVALRPAAVATADPRAALSSRRSFTRGQTLMIVGGAALLAGAVIGDDAGTIIMISGAGIGLYGLYLYLQ